MSGALGRPRGSGRRAGKRTAGPQHSRLWERAPLLAQQRQPVKEFIPGRLRSEETGISSRHFGRIDDEIEWQFKLLSFLRQPDLKTICSE